MPLSLQSPSFLSPQWCDRNWSPFVPFAVTRGDMPGITTDPGLYRVRVQGRDQLAYVGQTGRDLRERVGMLTRGTLATEMPFNDPHTAAPKLWSFRDAAALGRFQGWPAEMRRHTRANNRVVCHGAPR